MTYKGNEINKQTLDSTLQQEITNTSNKANNSWQRNKYNSVSTSNLGAWTAEKSFLVTDWKANGNVEQLDIIVPIGGSFSGLIKATYTSFWGGSDSHGGATVVYRIGNYQGQGTKLNDYVLETITPAFAKDFYIHQPYIDGNNGTIILLLSKAPSANNPFVVKLEFQGYVVGGKDAFKVMEETNFAIYDNGSPTHNGYPWTPQFSRIPTLTQIRFWDTSMWNDIVDGRNLKIENGTHNVADFAPAQFRDVLNHLLVNQKGTFKCLINTAEIGASSINPYGILTTIKPWHDESGGGLTQKFEAHDVIQKRFQIDATTWSPWITIQSKDVDIKQLFQSASDVKKNVAQAITDKGVQTSPDATGAQMAANIRAIQTGKQVDVLPLLVPALSPGQTTSIGMATLFQPVNASLNLDGVYLRNGTVQGNSWGYRHSVYNVRVVNAGNGLWNTFFDIRGGQNATSEQYNLAILTT